MKDWHKRKPQLFKKKPSYRPGCDIYPGRTRHFHVKFQAPNRPVLTTQLYFPNEPSNARDWIFRPELMMRITDGTAKVAHFDVVLDLA